MATVTVTINPETGERTYEIEGQPGVSCEDITELLRQNNNVLDMQYTEEHNLPDLLPDYINTGE